MNKILLIARPEYLSRVRKKSFIVMTILSPLLIMMFYGMIFYFTINRDISEGNKEIFVSDHSGLFRDRFNNDRNIKFNYGELDKEEEATLLANSEYYGILVIPQDARSLREATLIAREQSGMSTLSYIESQIDRELRNEELKDRGIDKSLVDSINKVHIKLKSVTYTSQGLQDSNAGVSTAIGFIG